jgi:hypothetical protein
MLLSTFTGLAKLQTKSRSPEWTGNLSIITMPPSASACKAEAG